MSQDNDRSGATSLRTFPARYESLEAIASFVRDACQAARLDETAGYQVRLSVDEACSNIIEHAYRGGSEDPIGIKCSVTPEALTIQVHDHGETFDLSQVRAPDLESSLEERRIGGLGIFLMRRYMDKVEFRSVPRGGPDESAAETGNFLILVKRRTKA